MILFMQQQHLRAGTLLVQGWQRQQERQQVQTPLLTTSAKTPKVYLVLHVEGDRVRSVPSRTNELNWDRPFYLEKGLARFPHNIFNGKMLLVEYLRHPETTPGVAYYRLGS
jgi:hypothetical protein